MTAAIAATMIAYYPDPSILRSGAGSGHAGLLAEKTAILSPESESESEYRVRQTSPQPRASPSPGHPSTASVLPHPVRGRHLWNRSRHQRRHREPGCRSPGCFRRARKVIHWRCRAKTSGRNRHGLRNRGVQARHDDCRHPHDAAHEVGPAGIGICRRRNESGADCPI